MGTTAGGMQAESEPDRPIAWPLPRPLLTISSPVLEFEVHSFLPEDIETFVLGVAAELQVAPDLIAIPLMVALSAALGRRAFVQPKRNASWRVRPNLWGLLVAMSGLMKSTAIQRGVAPYIELQREALRAVDRSLRYISSDPTLPKLLELLVHNPAGILVLRDEITGLFATLNRRDRETERQFYIEGWAGDFPFTMDRIGRGTIHVPHVCLSILGGIQPDRLRGFLMESSRMGTIADGFIQRFQLAVWPDQSADYRYVDEVPNIEVERQIESTFRRIVSMPADDPRGFRFDDDAQAVFVDWFERLEIRVRTEKMPEIMREHLSKYRSLMPSLAVILHVAEEKDPSEAIPMHRAARAIQWCEYLETHARRIYSSLIGSVNPGAMHLTAKLRGGELRQGFSIRELSEKGWSGLDAPDKARAAVQILEGAGWVRRVPRDLGQPGRPSERYAVNPRIAEI